MHVGFNASALSCLRSSITGRVCARDAAMPCLHERNEE